jgi:NADPH:quinone reductase-like Zn-dependent oxidoreductase
MRSFHFPVIWFWLPLRIAFGIRRPKRQVLGGYFSGEIESIGRSVTSYSVGDQVFGSSQLRFGAYGEFLVLPESYTVVPKPMNMTFIEAAAVPLGGLNALHFMTLAEIKPGEKVLINGAGGSIGAHAIQIAKMMGAEVTTVDKAAKKAIVDRFGADNFIDYQKEDFTKSAQTYDVIFDMVARSSYSGCLSRLNPHGRYLTGNPRLTTMIRSFFTTRFTNKTSQFAFAAETKDELLSLKAMIEDGQVNSIVDTAYPMDQAAEAHHHVEAENRLGSIVLAIGDKASETNGTT